MPRRGVDICEIPRDPNAEAQALSNHQPTLRRDLMTPLTSGGFDDLGRADSTGRFFTPSRLRETEAQVCTVCPNLVGDVDSWLSKPDGKPTVLYYLLNLSSISLAASYVFGTVLTDSLEQVYRTGDSLMVRRATL